MIKCPKCQADNDLGSIFCRDCGERINIEDLKPDDVIKAAKGKKNRKKVAQGIRSLIGLVVFLAVAGLLVAVFMTPGFRKPDELTQDEGKVPLKRMMQISKVVGEFAFTEKEASYIAQKMSYLTEEEKMKAITEEGSGLLPDKIWINFDGPGRIKIVLKSLWNESMPMYTVVVGDLQPAGKGLKFVVKETYAGRMPVHPLGDGLAKNLHARFDPLMTGDRFDDLMNKILANAKSATVAEGKITVKR